MRKDKHYVNSLYASCKKIGYDHCGQGWGLKAFTPFESENDTRTADVMSRDRYRRPQDRRGPREDLCDQDRKSTRLNSSHEWISYAVFCLKKKKKKKRESNIAT